MKTLPCNCKEDASFERHELVPGLFGHRCPDCLVVLLPLKGFRAWRDRNFPDWNKTEPEPSPSPAIEPPSRLRGCPSCLRGMNRYRTGNEESFWIDHCPSCDFVLLDADEWETLDRAGLGLHIETLLTERWQKRVVTLRAAVSRETLLRERFGSEEALAEIRRFKAWMNQQPNSKAIIAYLGDPDN